MSHKDIQDLNNNMTQAQYADKENTLLVIIHENSRLPEKDQLRYQELWNKCENETISDDELTEYQNLLSQLEARNLKRIDALIALARSRERTLEDIIAELALKEENSVI